MFNFFVLQVIDLLYSLFYLFANLQKGKCQYSETYLKCFVYSLTYLFHDFLKVMRNFTPCLKRTRQDFSCFDKKLRHSNKQKRCAQINQWDIENFALLKALMWGGVQLFGVWNFGLYFLRDIMKMSSTSILLSGRMRVWSSLTKTKLAKL